MENIGNRLFKVEFAETSTPEFLAQKNKEWILFGVKNDYTKYIIDLFNRNAINNSIITAKTNYIFGKGLTYDKKKVEDVKAQAKLDKFLAYANRWQTWDDISQKIILDLELFNGYALQVVYGAAGKIADVYHIEFSKIRIGKDKKTAYYCENWFNRNPENDPSFKCFPLYDENQKSGSSILYYKISRPTSEPYGDTYPLPDYIGCTADIETDINISTFHLSNSANGMTAQALLTFFNGQPTEEDKRMIKKMFEKNHTGANNAGSVILNFVDENQKGVELQNLAAPDLDKQFEVLAKRIQQNIFVGHKIDPVLMGIDTATSWNRPQMLEKWEKFQRTYIDLRKPHVLNTIKMFGQLAGVLFEEIYFEELTPIGVEIPLSEQEIVNNLTFDEKRQLISKKFGIELTAVEDDKDKRLTLATKLGVGGVASLLQVIQSPLPVKQKVALLNGVFGVSLKKAYDITGFTPETAQTVVAQTKMSADLLLEALLNCGEDENDDEVLEVKCVDFDNAEDAEKFEKFQAHKFADVVTGDVKTIRKKILDLLGGNPSIEPSEIAKLLGLDEDYILEQINNLIDSGIITEGVEGFTPTGKGFDIAEEVPIAKTEVYTVYKYGLREDLNEPDLKPTSREFCVKMINAKKEYTREQIDNLSNQFGTNVWLYRGGFWNDGKEINPYCRHVFKAVTKIRRSKK